jgi:hypothetical protein
MMEDGDQGQDVNSPGVSEEIDLSDETNDNKSVSQGSDDSSVSAKMLNAATSAGKTIVKVTEDTIQKVAASADEVLRPHDTSIDEGGVDGEKSSSISPKKEGVEDEMKEEQEPVTTKVLHAATAAGKTVVDVAKRTGDALHKVVESAMHKQKSGEEENEKETSPHETSDGQEAITEEKVPEEPVTTKVYHAATAAGKTVVDLSVSAAKYTGEVIHKVAASAGEVLHKEKPHTPPEGTEGEDGEPGKEGDVPADEASAASTPQPKPEEEPQSQGIRMWSSVRRMSEKVLSISKAAAAVQSSKEPEAKAEIEAQETEGAADVGTTEAGADAERSRSGSMTQLWSSVKKTADSIADSASAAYKAAEPVAISTASKVSHGAQSVWSTTKEKVFPSKKVDSEDSGDLKPEGSPADTKEAEAKGTTTAVETTEEEKQQNAEQLLDENEVNVEVEESTRSPSSPQIVATSAEPEIVSTSVQSDQDKTTTNEEIQQEATQDQDNEAAQEGGEKAQSESNEDDQKEES